MTTKTVAAKTEPAFIFLNDEPMPEFVDMPFEDIEELPLEHPGAHDPEYRKRRDYIASLSKKFREDPNHKIIDVEYTPEEQRIWQIVATKLEEMHRKYASSVYLEAKKKLGISNESRIVVTFGKDWGSPATRVIWTLDPSFPM